MESELTNSQAAEQLPSSSSEALTEQLPTRRIAFAKQLDLLRAYAALGASGQAASNQEVAKLVGMSEKTTTLANAFFLDTGLVIRGERGNTPAAEVVSFQRAYQWNPEEAPLELAPILERTWFAQALIPHLALGHINEGKAMAILGQASGATRHRSPELRMLLDYLTAAGLVVRDDGQVKAPTHDRRDSAVQTPSQASATSAPSAPPTRTGALPLLIQGLLEQLPREGRWTRAKADKWIEMMRLTLDVVYEIETQADEETTTGNGS